MKPIEMMNSAEYKEWFRADYHRLKDRYDELNAMVEKWDKGELDFKPTCPRSLYSIQLITMYNYLNVLKERAQLEGVEL